MYFYPRTLCVLCLFLSKTNLAKLKFTHLLLGFAALLPASVLLFSLWEFALLAPQGDFGHALLTALLVSFVSAWSCYIVSITQLLKNKEVPTSLEGMMTSLWVGAGYAGGFVILQNITLKLQPTPYSVLMTVMGILAACAIQGFYIGFSKARMMAEEAKGFILRQIGIAFSTFILLGFLFLSYRQDASWIGTATTIGVAGTGLVLAIHYVRASRQRKRYMSRRYKQRSSHPFAVAQHQSHLQRTTVA